MTPRELLTIFGPVELRQVLPTQSKELTTTEFAYPFPPYRDVFCSALPDRRPELDNYLTLILNLALRFGNNGFYSYHVLFSSEVAGHVQQYNLGAYWGTP
ncbi:hypothetical protein EYF80_054302 [Liparis tanakae]|uniref:Uncharacterized protein n=1 Tax=Liparis tanakae TaxID=230148 RepID=A0A4Z2F4Y9_9TELE|nr:hypothetical protein EYF80_054302 [Liparis tanakae]